jgi:hypothetical protein
VTTNVLEFTEISRPVEGPADDIPSLDVIEYPCEVCGREAGPYSGRGRKPKYCADHKRNKNTNTSPRVKGTNASLAAQATEALVQINNMGAVFAMVLGYHETAGAISDKEEIFRQQTYSALLTDPSLCNVILRAGTNSAKLSLAISYGMFGAAIAPVAIMEFKEKRDAALAKVETD